MLHWWAPRMLWIDTSILRTVISCRRMLVRGFCTDALSSLVPLPLLLQLLLYLLILTLPADAVCCCYLELTLMIVPGITAPLTYWDAKVMCHWCRQLAQVGSLMFSTDGTAQGPWWAQMSWTLDVSLIYPAWCTLGCMYVNTPPWHKGVSIFDTTADANNLYIWDWC